MTSGNIFVDTIRPRITPDGGSANYSIINGTDNPVIRNVTVTDGDPNYSGNYTLITPNGLVNAKINGSIYNYTYTAVADGAGNPGASVSRIITIIDALPIGVTSLSITSNSGNNFANAGKIITLSLETDSNDLGSITGTLLGREFTSTINGGSATFTTTVLSNDTNGNVTFSIEATNSSDGRVSISESDLDLGSFVTIDTVLPVITLNDNNNTIIPQGVKSYEDLGAISSDLSYATDKQLVGIGYVDYTRVGNYTLVYTDTDAAGNKATSILNIVVLAAPPIDIETLTIRNGANASSSYVKAGDDLTIQLSINYTIASYTATIFGIEQSESNQNSKGFLISQQVPSNLTIEEYASFTITMVLLLSFNVMTGKTVSIVTNEPRSRSLSEIETRPSLEFVASIENVTFPFVSLDKTVVVNVALPPFIVLVNSRPSKVPVMLPRSLLSVSRLRVIILPAFAKLLPELLVILSDVTPIGSASIIVMILLTLAPGLPAPSATAVYV